MTDQVSFAVGEAKRVSETNEAIEGMSTKIHEMAESVVEISSLVEKQLTNIENTARQSQDVAAIAEKHLQEQKKFAVLRMNKLVPSSKLNPYHTG